MKPLPSSRALLALLLVAAASGGACSSDIAGQGGFDQGQPEDPGGPEDPGEDPGDDPSGPGDDPGDPGDPEPEPPNPPGFDLNNPNDYLWTVKVESFYTLEVLQGSALVQWSHYAPGIDPASGAATATGALAGKTVLAENMRYHELTAGAFVFETSREQDGQPMSSCVKLVEAADAIRSHNQILEAGYPLADPSGFTNPDLYATHLSQLPGMVLLVDGDCTTPSADNPTELRSVLRFAAVTFSAVPDPQEYDPGTDPDPGAGIHPASP